MEGFTDLINTVDIDQARDGAYAGMTVKAKEAIHCGGAPPLGYDVGADGKLTINEAEANIVREIFRLYSLGYSYNEMMERLNANGLQTKAGRISSA